MEQFYNKKKVDIYDRKLAFYVLYNDNNVKSQQ